MITSLRLQNFRSYVDDSFEFEEGVNIIVGPNASGKTNMLESILVASSGSSYRVNDQDLIQFNKPWARIDVVLRDQNRSVKIVRENDKTSKNYTFDDKDYKRLSFSQTIPVVLFEPNHLRLLHGQPDGRRAYLDDLLERLNPQYKNTLKQYKRILAQRNALLKSHRRPSLDQLFVWNLRLSEFGGLVAVSRNSLVGKISEQFPSLYRNISGSDDSRVTVAYDSKLNVEQYETSMLKALEKSYNQDIERGFTTYGPHRDDFSVRFNKHLASDVASRGETRTVLLAFKISELLLVEEQRQAKPIMLLDDVFSELDGKRRHALASYLQDHQTFITTTDADFVLDDQMQSSNIIPISK